MISPGLINSSFGEWGTIWHTYASTTDHYKILNCLPIRSIFFRLSWQFKQEKSTFGKASFLQNKNWLWVQDFVYKTLWLLRISLLIGAITKSFEIFSGKLIYNLAIENFFNVFA